MSTITQAQPRQESNRRQILIAAVLGLVAAVLIIIYLNNAGEGGGTTPVADTAQIVVAAHTIDAGDSITHAMVTTRSVAVSAVPQDAIRDQNLAIGQVARYPIERGEQVSTARLVEAPKVQSLSFQIPEGKRGMTI